MAFLNSDDLGETAHNAFTRLCSSAALVSNKSSDRDRTGWDSRVELPNNELKAKVPLDQRDVPAPFMVQVKGILKGKETVQLNLKTLERFAKLSEPALICILEFEDADTVSNAYFVHLLDKPLATFLKRLTSIDVNGKQLTGKETLSYSKKKYWNSFDFSADGLRNLLSKEIMRDQNVKQYADEKNAQLKQLGYAAEPFTGNFKLEIENEEQYSDFTLGLTKLKAKDFKVFEERFGFKRQVSPKNFTDGEIQVTPSNKKSVLAHFNINGVNDPIVFNANMVIPAIPPSSIEKLRFLIEINPLKIDIKPEGDFEFSLNDEDKLKCLCDEWVNYLTVMDGLSLPDFHFKLTSLDMKLIWRAHVNETPDFDKSIVGGNRYHLNTAKYLQKILNRCGGQRLAFTFDEMNDASEKIRECYASLFVNGKEVSAKLEWQGEQNMPNNGEVEEGAYGNIFQLGDFFIAYVRYMKTSFIKREDLYELSGKLNGDYVVSVVKKEKYETFLDEHIDPTIHKIRLILNAE